MAFGFYYVFFSISSVSVSLSFYLVIVLLVIWLSGGCFLVVLFDYEYGLWNNIGPFGGYVFVWIYSWDGINADVNYKIGMAINIRTIRFERDFLVLWHVCWCKEDRGSVEIQWIIGRLIRHNVSRGRQVCSLVSLNQRQKLHYIYKIGVSNQERSNSMATLWIAPWSQGKIFGIWDKWMKSPRATRFLFFPYRRISPRIWWRVSTYERESIKVSKELVSNFCLVSTEWGMRFPGIIKPNFNSSREPFFTFLK